MVRGGWTPSLFRNFCIAKAIDDYTRLAAKMKPFLPSAPESNLALLQEASEHVSTCEGRKFEALVCMTWKATQNKPEARAEALLARLGKFNATQTPHSCVHPGLWSAVQGLGPAGEKSSASSAALPKKLAGAKAAKP